VQLIAMLRTATQAMRKFDATVLSQIAMATLCSNALRFGSMFDNRN
jgi:hypothetical protein